MAQVRPFWTSTLQDLSNGVKNTSMQGVLTPAIVSEFLGVPEDSQVPFSRVWVATSHFPQSGVATKLVGYPTSDSTFTYQKGTKNTSLVDLLINKGVVDNDYFQQSLSLISKGGA